MIYESLRALSDNFCFNQRDRKQFTIHHLHEIELSFDGTQVNFVGGSSGMTFKDRPRSVVGGRSAVDQSAVNSAARQMRNLYLKFARSSTDKF